MQYPNLLSLLKLLLIAMLCISSPPLKAQIVKEWKPCLRYSLERMKYSPYVFADKEVVNAFGAKKRIRNGLTLSGAIGARAVLEEKYLLDFIQVDAVMSSRRARFTQMPVPSQDFWNFLFEGNPGLVVTRHFGLEFRGGFRKEILTIGPLLAYNYRYRDRIKEYHIPELQRVGLYNTDEERLIMRRHDLTAGLFLGMDATNLFSLNLEYGLGLIPQILYPEIAHVHYYYMRMGITVTVNDQ